MNIIKSITSKFWPGNEALRSGHDSQGALPHYYSDVELILNPELMLEAKLALSAVATRLQRESVWDDIQGPITDPLLPNRRMSVKDQEYWTRINDLAGIFFDLYAKPKPKDEPPK